MIAVITVVATALLFAWEYFVSTVPKRGLTSRQGLTVALLVAFVTVLAFDVGMLGPDAALSASSLCHPQATSRLCS